jgi:hypothetical protein
MNETPEIKDLERKHHPFSPSKLQSFEACACYLGKDEAGEAAQRGTLQHHAAETRTDLSILDDDEMDAVTECIDFIDEKRNEMEAQRAEFIGEQASIQMAERGATEEETYERFVSEWEAKTPAVIEISEEYLPIDAEKWEYFDLKTKKRDTFIGTTAGYIDRALLAHTRDFAVLVDFKFGRWPVTKASENLQGIAYALGLKKKYPSLKRIRVYFKLPHQNKLDFHEFDVSGDTGDSGYNALYLRIKTVVARAALQTFAQADKTFAAATPNVPTCIFCARLGLCDKVAVEMLKVCHKFAPLKVPEDITPSKLRGPGDAAVAMRCAQVAKVWSDSVRQIISGAVISGNMAMPPGYKIESRDGNRKVSDMRRFEMVAQEHGVPPSVIDSAKRITMEPIENDIKERAPRGTKTHRLEEFKAALDQSGAIIRSEGYSFLKAIPTKE